MNTTRAMVVAVLTVCVLAAVYVVTGRHGDDDRDTTKAPDAVAAAPIGAATPVDTFEVSVPAVDNPSLGVPHQVALGDRVVFVVRSERVGKVAVHGLSGEADVGPSIVARLTMTPATTGRFPLHFHGADGAHFAISAIDVYPKD